MLQTILYFLEVQEYQLKVEFLISEVNPEFLKAWKKYGDTPERLVSHSYYLEHTEEFFSYYKDCLIFSRSRA